MTLLLWARPMEGACLEWGLGSVSSPEYAESGTSQIQMQLCLAVCQASTCWIWCQPNLDAFILDSIPSPRHASCQALGMHIEMCILSWNARWNDHVPLAHPRE
jgi:hypothetical protein